MDPRYSVGEVIRGETNTKYRVGDIVRVRDDLNPFDEYPMEGYDRGIDIDRTGQMRSFCGKHVTISGVLFVPSSVFGDFSYKVEEDEEECCWTDGMFDDCLSLGGIAAAESLKVLYDWL